MEQVEATNTDAELGNETENEVIRDHLDGLQGFGSDSEQAVPNSQGHYLAVPSALKGLESDLETIFETDLESNYVTTARTNMSMKKLFHQVNQRVEASAAAAS